MSCAEGRSLEKKANAINPPASGRPTKVMRSAIRTGERIVAFGPSPPLLGLLSRYGPRRSA
jgi:hypothetical protein